MLVILYRGLQLVLSKTIRIGDTKYHVSVVCVILTYQNHRQGLESTWKSTFEACQVWDNRRLLSNFWGRYYTEVVKKVWLVDWHDQHECKKKVRVYQAFTTYEGVFPLTNALFGRPFYMEPNCRIPMIPTNL